MSKQKRRSKLSFFALDPNCDKYINWAVALLLLVGTFTIISTNVGKTTSAPNIVPKVLIKQCMFAVCGYIAMWFMNRWFRFKWYSKLENGIILALLVMLILPLFSAEIGGSHAWILIGGISLQPSEFAKPLIILICATCLYRAKTKTVMLKEKGHLFIKAWAAFIFISFIVAMQKDMGTLVIICFIFLSCIMIPKYVVLQRTQKVLKVLVYGAIAAAIVLFGITNIGTEIIKHTPLAHIAVRVENFKDPYTDVYGDGYQPANSLYGIASSDIHGKGIGNSTRKYGYLTQADNDYILAVLLEETGIFGLFGLVILYGMIEIRLFYYAFKTSEDMYKVILGGTGVYLFMHFFLNAGGVACLIPFTGVPLLFISSGGTSLMSIMLTMGLAQNCICSIRRKEMDRLL